MEPEYISREEHSEFAKRIEAEDARQNRRIELLEANVLEMGQLTATVAKLSINLEAVIKEQANQGIRLETLEGRDGEKWRNVTGYIITFIVGLVVSYIFSQIGI